MEKVQIYLKSAILTRKAKEDTRRITPIRSVETTAQEEKITDPVPSKSMILDATIEQSLQNGFVVVVHKYYSVKHEDLDGEQTKLFLPTAKIDHLRLLD